MATPTGLSRRELFIDARDLQREDEDGTIMPEDEYISILTTRGEEKLGENQLVRSFSATVRTIDPTYVYGKDFFLGDTITVTDERIGITVDAVVEAVQHSFSGDGESLVFTFGYGQPTLYDILRRKAEK